MKAVVYTQKNVAGIVAMLTIVIGATWIAGATGRRQIMLAVLALAPALLFLALTRSKTSINLAAGGLVIIAFFVMAERYGAAFILLAATLGLAGAAGVLALLLAIDFDTNIALSSLFGDTTFTGRDELWAFTQREARRYWLGHGYGAFWDVGAVNDPLAKLEPGTWLASVEIGTINQAHQRLSRIMAAYRVAGDGRGDGRDHSWRDVGRLASGDGAGFAPDARRDRRLRGAAAAAIAA